MRTVHKYVLTGVVNEVSTFEGAKWLHVANQNEQIAVWAEVNTLERECMATLHLVGTGQAVPRHVEHIGSALMDSGRFVFHVYAPTPTTEALRAPESRQA